MKLRKHKGNQTYRISWTVAGASRTETHLDERGKARKVVVEGVTTPRRTVIVSGSNPTSVLNAFLSGRDRYAITAQINRVLDDRHTTVLPRGNAPSISILYFRGVYDISNVGVSR